ncbi:MAG: hypothetical protein K2Y20_10865 [Sphingomonas sp.]|nr:hypothetical protein [Sphingomonas sp.]
MKRRVMAGTVAGALLAAVLVAPAFGAPDASLRAPHPPLAKGFSGIDGFTPAFADRRLAAMVGKARIGARDYQFTPAEARRSTAPVAFAAKTIARAQTEVDAAPVGTTVNVAPIAYNLGVSVGWKKFVGTTDAVRADPVGSARSFDLGVPVQTARSARLHPLPEAPVVGAKLTGDDRTVSTLDSTNAFRLTRNVDLTGGSRFKSENYRLDRVRDDRRDSQAVYIGTALRF